ncbi:MAG: hypothetical protein FWG88_08095 [Oscillospiraceae bacterium]|nr:hypothetical protein [Oscillospiraceae bacterium]
MPKTVAIDTDFLNHLIDIKNHSNVYELIVRFFKELDFIIYMHPLVFMHEKSPISNIIFDKLFDENIILVPDMNDILSAKTGGKLMYENMVTQIYSAFVGKQYPDEDVFNTWRRGMNLGEVHTAALCVFFDFEYLLSDDNDVVKHLSDIIKRETQATVNILNREMCGEIIKDSDSFSRRERRLLTHI